MKTTILAVVFFAAGIAPALAGESAATTNSAPTAADMQQVLDRLQGSSGLYGANAAEMSAFAGSVDTEQLALIVGRLSNQLNGKGNAESMDLQAISAFVQQNLSKDDVEALLGRGVTEEKYQQALKAGGDPQNLDALVKMLK